MDQSQDRRRGAFHRGRRGPDRRGMERRAQPQAQARDQVDVEQIMREIRGRIAQRQGIDLSTQQLQDLASRRLESILDPRAIKPSLLDALRRNAGAVPPAVSPQASSEPAYAFEDTTLYDSHRAVLRSIRKLLNPLLKLFFNPNPLIRALHLQARLNVEAAERESERDRHQAEWNALHFEILQRLVTEVSRVSLDVQALTLRVESLGARVDFTDRRVRSIEGAAPHVRGRIPEAIPPTGTAEAAAATGEGMEASGADGGRRKRRRRRGRRSGVSSAEAGPTAESTATGAGEALDDTPSPVAAPISVEAAEHRENEKPGLGEQHDPGVSTASQPAAGDEPSRPAAPSLDPDHSDLSRTGQ